MKTPDPDISKLNSGGLDVRPNSIKTRISETSAGTLNRHLTEFTLFTCHFNRIPNAIHEKKINCHRAHAWFVEEYGHEVQEYYFSKVYYGENGEPRFDDCYYFLYEDLMVYFDINQNLVRFWFKKTALEQVEKLAAHIRKFKKRKRTKPEISLLVQAQSGVQVKSLEISRTSLQLEDNYNDDFKEVHQTILTRLRKKKDKGIVLLHGKPGTGKTSYIRYLISRLKKHVIFLPPNMAQSITNPDLLSVLIHNPGTILVIEDAENLVMDRERNSASPVSTLLNISDGLLSDCLNIQIICSFNTDLSKVDQALIRKGRLIGKYEFKELTVEKAKSLSQKLGLPAKIERPMTLTDIYNQEEKEYQRQETQKAIGFQSLKAS